MLLLIFNLISTSKTIKQTLELTQPTFNMAAKKKKAKGKGKAKEKQLDVPAEWIGKSVEELRSLVSQLESDLDEKRKTRSR